MKQILFFEFGLKSVRLMRYDKNRYIDIDISGGYGSLYVPLMIHYVEDDYLIGHECFHFEMEDSSLLFSNIRSADEQARRDFFLKLSEKIQSVIRIEESIDVVLIDRGKGFLQDIDETYLKDLKVDHIKCITYEQALAGYVSAYCPEQETYSLVLSDHDYIYDYQMLKCEGNYVLDIKKYVSHLSELEEGYLNLFAMDHYGSNYLTCKAHEQHMIAGLFHGQEASVQKQLSNGGNLNIYSSLVFPPRKILIFDYQVQELIDQVREAISLLVDHKNWKVLMDYPFIEKLLLNNHIDLVSNKKILLDGTRNYIENEKDMVIENTEDAGVNIGLINNDEFVVLARKLNQDNRCRLDLIASQASSQVGIYMEKNDEKTLIYELMIEECHSLKRIIIDLIFESDNKLKEVRYEFGNL